ncbi:MAG: acyclic terpene utilization AtuA family protein [Gemmataceae bacterium]
MMSIRIGNGCGFWGDNLDAPVLLAEKGQLDYLTLEYLAELTMSILALQKQKNPTYGYARDFLTVLERLCPILQAQPNLKIITNAGGMNPQVCAATAKDILARWGLEGRTIATVDGDDLLPNLDDLLSQGHGMNNLENDGPLSAIRDRVVSANAYLGARPIAEALGRGASIVITGRVADASLTVGPAVHELGWSWDDWDRLCAATVAGHLIECGAQVTGGLWCNWQEADLTNVGYPIAVIDEDGTVRITKPEGTGGAVNVETVTEQLLYEVGDPANYLTPDVVADFTTLDVRACQRDVVKLSGITGKPKTDSYKVSMAYRNGFAASGTLLIYGPKAATKAQACGDMIFRRLERAGVTFEDTLVECLGAGSTVPLGELRSDLEEVVLRISVRDSEKAKVERFTKEVAPLVTSGPPGVSGYTGGRAPVREVFAYWPTLIAKDAVEPQVRILS